MEIFGKKIILHEVFFMVACVSCLLMGSGLATHAIETSTDEIIWRNRLMADQAGWLRELRAENKKLEVENEALYAANDYWIDDSSHWMEKAGQLWGQLEEPKDWASYAIEPAGRWMWMESIACDDFGQWGQCHEVQVELRKTQDMAWVLMEGHEELCSEIREKGVISIAGKCDDVRRDNAKVTSELAIARESQYYWEDEARRQRTLRVGDESSLNPLAVGSI